MTPSRTAVLDSRGELGAVAQLGARLNRTQEVRGSNPLGSTKLDKIKNLHVEVRVISLTGVRRWNLATSAGGVYIGGSLNHPAL